MNIGSFQHKGAMHYGAFTEAEALPASASLRAHYPNLRDLLDAGAVDALRDDIAGRETVLPLSEIDFLPPIPNPRKIICVGMNYPKPYPVEGVAPPVPNNVILFGRERETLVGHGQALCPPLGQAAESFDYEGEIALVIGKTARHVSADEAMAHVLGYSVFNDGSVREWQGHSLYAGKNFAQSGSWGPWIALADAVGPAEDLHLTVRLNGDLVQETTARAMIYSMAEQISYASHLFTLSPGDVIATGSPDGTGGSRNPKRFLVPGDQVTMTVDGVGTLANPVV